MHDTIDLQNKKLQNHTIGGEGVRAQPATQTICAAFKK